MAPSHWLRSPRTSFPDLVGAEADTPGAPDVTYPEEGRLSRDHLVRLVDLLGVTGMLYLALWEGMGEIKPRLRRTSLVQLPSRRCLLLTGDADDLVHERWAPRGSAFPAAATVWWPPTREWLVATDVDLDVTHVGGSDDLVRRLQSDDLLEVVRA